MSRILDYIIIFLTIVAFIVGGYYFYLYFSQEYFPPDVKMPDLIGIKYEDAVDKLNKLGLRVERVNEKPSKKFKKGLVIFQKPQAGIRIKKERGIYLEVSSGKLDVLVPDLTRKSLEEAKSILARFNLKLGKVSNFNGKLPIMSEKDMVLKQEPKPSEYVALDTKINLWIVKNIKMVKIPDFRKKTLSYAKNFLSRHNLYIGTLKWTKSKYKSGTILSQNPLPNAQIPQTSMVSFLISSADKDVSLVKTTLIVKLPLFKGIKAVSIAQEDAELTKQVYQGTNKGGQELILDLQYKKKAKLKIYIEGKLKKELTLN